MIGDTPVQLVLKIRYQANDAGISLEQQDQIFRVAHRQRPEQQHVHNCENQSGGADPMARVETMRMLQRNSCAAVLWRNVSRGCPAVLILKIL